MLRTRAENREVEYLLSRQSHDDTEGLVSLLATLSLDRLNVDVESRAPEFAAMASRLVLAGPVVAPSRPMRSRVVPRLATAGLTAVLLTGLAGVAQAADAAAPGDNLYGLDRALEGIGINDGGINERLDEAQALADDGHSAEALAHLANAMEHSSPNAANALEAAAERFGLHDDPSQVVRENVADMLEWIAQTDATGREFGQGVAERAHEIGAGQGDTPPVTLPDLPDTASDNQGNAGDKGNNDDSVTNDGSSGSSDGGDNSGGGDSGRGGGSGGGNGPPGGTPPGQSGG
jgi:uncharacterized membrane protein YgcG